MQTNFGTLFEAQGILRYTEKPTYKCILEIDQEIVNYYRWFLPKCLEINPQKYRAHISIVRKEIPKNLDFWAKYEGKVINFWYQNVIYNGEIYFWLDAYSLKLEKIREELGLSNVWIYDKPLIGFNKIFHITLGNVKKNLFD